MGRCGGTGCSPPKGMILREVAHAPQPLGSKYLDSGLKKRPIEWFEYKSLFNPMSHVLCLSIR